jgi:hypothetical protein
MSGLYIFTHKVQVHEIFYAKIFFHNISGMNRTFSNYISLNFYYPAAQTSWPGGRIESVRAPGGGGRGAEK